MGRADVGKALFTSCYLWRFAVRLLPSVAHRNSAFGFREPSFDIQVSGGLTARVTPVPIPNTEVKPRRADDTARATAWERRSPPGLNFKGRPESIGPAFLFFEVMLRPYSIPARANPV